MMTGGRVLYKVSQDGQAPRACGLLSRWGTPHMALLAQGLWALVLVWLPGVNLPGLLSYVGTCIRCDTIYSCSACCSYLSLSLCMYTHLSVDVNRHGHVDLFLCHRARGARATTD